MVIKAPKEYILAAKLNSEIKIYLPEIDSNHKKTIGAITAFFDDYDEPLIITTPLFEDKLLSTFFKILGSDSIKVHFFDELSRELLVYDASLSIPISTSKNMNKAEFLEPSLLNAKIIQTELFDWFGRRSQQDDDEAITVSLNTSIYDENLCIQDLRTENNTFHGSLGFHHTTLEIKEPGKYQENDIVQCLLNVFPGEQIFLNPKRTYDQEEMCDILVITNNNILIIQAKASPNIERISRQVLSRKKSNTLKALKKAAKQVSGAITYLQREKDLLEFFIGEEKHSVSTYNINIYSMIIVKELFNDNYKEYSPILFKVLEEKNIPCLALDYPELYQYCVNLRGEASFFKAYSFAISKALQNKEFPRLRFGFVDGKS